MIYFIIFVIIAWIWIAYEFNSAPYSDSDGNIKLKNKKHGKDSKCKK
jgi:hypothetical protein